MSHRRRRALPFVLAALSGAALASPAAAQLPLVDVTVPAARETEPVIITGARLPSWAVPSNQTFQPPLADFGECPPSWTPPSEPPNPTTGGADDLTEGFSSANCPEGYDPHNHYADPAVDTADIAAPAGTPIDRMLGYRWDATAKRFTQIPFQVDEQFTRYLDNTASGFAIYSGQDQHTTYAYDGPGDREGFRFTKDGPADDPCRAQPASPAQGDPVAGLDSNDEVSFMASDAGPSRAVGRHHTARHRRRVRGPGGGPDQSRRTGRLRLRDAARRRTARSPRSTPPTATSATSVTPTPTCSPSASPPTTTTATPPGGLYCDAAGNVVRNAGRHARSSAVVARATPRRSRPTATATATTAAG